MHAQKVYDAKGDILPTLGLAVAIQAWYCAFGIPGLYLYGALATEPMFGDSCSSYNVFPLTNILNQRYLLPGIIL